MGVRSRGDDHPSMGANERLKEGSSTRGNHVVLKYPLTCRKKDREEHKTKTGG